MSQPSGNFDWISIVAVIVAGVIAVIKGQARKKPVTTPTWGEEEVFEEEGNEKDATVPVSKQREVYPNIVTSFSDPSMDGQNDLKEKFPEESDGAEPISFDIRQAIISSEILKRPEF